ncbi:MAG: hypothetical protein ABIO34_04995, partial [Arthrobacter oryzae]
MTHSMPRPRRLLRIPLEERALPAAAPVRAGAGPSGTNPFNLHSAHEVLKHGRVPALGPIRAYA